MNTWEEIYNLKEYLASLTNHYHAQLFYDEMYKQAISQCTSNSEYINIRLKNMICRCQKCGKRIEIYKEQLRFRNP